MGNYEDARFTEADAATIKQKVRKLIGRYGFTASDAEDLQQDLAQHVSTQIAEHDPTRASRSTFVDRVVHNRIVNILEHRMAQKRWSGAPTVDLDHVPEGPHLDDHTDPAALDTILDVRAAVAALPAELQSVAALLGEHSPAEAARILGLSRGQFRQKQLEIKSHFEKRNLHGH